MSEKHEEVANISAIHYTRALSGGTELAVQLQLPYVWTRLLARVALLFALHSHVVRKNCVYVAPARPDSASPDPFSSNSLVPVALGSSEIVVVRGDVDVVGVDAPPGVFHIEALKRVLAHFGVLQKERMH